MPPKQKSKMQLEAERDKMVDAALDIILDHGINALTINKIAKEFGMSAANVYNYFESKNEILLCVRRRGAELFYKRVSSAAEEHTDVLEKVRAFMEAAVDFGYKNRKYYDLIIADYHGQPIATDPSKRYTDMPGLRMADYLMDLIRGYLSQKDENEIKVLGTFIFVQLHGLIDYNNKSIIERVGVCYKDVCNYVFNEIIKELGRLKSEEKDGKI